MPTVAGKEPVAGFSPQPTPVLTQFFEQLGAEQDIAVFAALSSADMNHHALAVDIADLQVCYLSTPQTDRKSTRLNSSHQIISYAVCCLKKKKSTSAEQWQGLWTPRGLRCEAPSVRAQE